jgi:hypothetical protein
MQLAEIDKAALTRVGAAFFTVEVRVLLAYTQK